ncbi:DUF6538 domain-containing protein [Methylobacterium sp. WCS2018Hpa-22]|uniref:DUF6538 domain-containing protein n=1 Tax=Methylobacterium sp. WCS2018Hpa-22 TaxID=3073633 RepID=UPI00288BCA64|nr:DUF6538 domain-containing protein [Methylobacterium sp. WCS2018Hpa-22]
MPSPVKDRHGTYYLRRRVPKDLLDHVGSPTIRRSLKTKDPSEAKRLMVRALAELDAEWQSHRSGPLTLTERETHELARPVHDYLVARSIENPSLRHVWFGDLYDRVWITRLDRDVLEHTKWYEDEDMACIVHMYSISMSETDRLIEEKKLNFDNQTYWLFAKAVGDAYHRADRVLDKLSKGYDLPRKLEPRIADFLVSATKIAPIEIFQTKTPEPNSNSKTDKRLSVLFDEWWSEASRRGIKKSTYASYKHTIDNFIKYIGFDDAPRIRPNDIIAFKNYRLETPSPKTGKLPSIKTVKDSDLAALKAVFRWGVVNRKLESNPAADVTIKARKPIKLRSKGFTDLEAIALLKAALLYENARESNLTAAAKRWVPWLCAFTGARVGEIAQLRREDVRLEGDYWLIRITPEAGTQKTDEAREVVLHPQLVALGFPEFCGQSSEGHLFLQRAKNGDVLGPLQGLKNRLAEFARLTVSDPNVMPNHGWRHRFKTIGLDAGIEMRILDAIQGHAPRSVADRYGDISRKVIATAIWKLPSFDI